MRRVKPVRPTLAPPSAAIGGWMTRGTDAEIDAAFIQAYRTLRSRIEAFLALPLDELKKNPADLKAELDRIGTQY